MLRSYIEIVVQPSASMSVVDSGDSNSPSWPLQEEHSEWSTEPGQVDESGSRLEQTDAPPQTRNENWSEVCTLYRPSSDAGCCCVCHSL